MLGLRAAGFLAPGTAAPLEIRILASVYA